MQATEQNKITLPLHNWEALHQLEREKNYFSNATAESAAGIASSPSLGSPEFLVLTLAYKPLNRVTKLVRIIKVMRLLLEEFSSQGIQIFPCLEVPDHEPIDLFVILPEKAYLLISIRSKSTKEAKVIYNEANETLYTKHKSKGLRKWLPCPLVELSDYHAWLGKNRRLFGISANAIRRYSVIKALVLWKPMQIDRHREHLYSKVGEMTALTLSRKGTALLIEEDEILDFVKACLVEAKEKATK